MGRLGFDPALLEDLSNLVTCCRPSNDFGNRYIVVDDPPPFGDDETFWGIRDKVFEERRVLIGKRRASAAERYERIRRFIWLPGDVRIQPAT